MVPDTYYETFLQLGTLRVLPEDLAQGLAPSAGLRNRLVHEYDDVDDAIVYASVNEATKLYTDYAAPSPSISSTGNVAALPSRLFNSEFTIQN